jgi:hypothetical protein
LKPSELSHRIPWERIMKTFLKIIGILAGVLVLGILLLIVLTPWMDRWGASKAEVAAAFTGDKLVPAPRVIYNRAVTVRATPEQIYPWIAQLGAGRGGMYSYAWFETNILRCELINAERIHAEWQGLKVGDKVKMCPGDWGPPAYEVAALEPDRALVLGHQEDGKWVDVWQFILVPQDDGTTRLVLRSRDTKAGLMWDAFRPGEFIMVRGMLLGIRERAELLADQGSIVGIEESTPTAEVFIPLDKAIGDYGLTLDGVHLDIAGTTLTDSFPPGCGGEAPDCTAAQPGHKFVSVTFAPRDLPQGGTLAYKSLPPVSIAVEGGQESPCGLRKYDYASGLLTVGCEVPGAGSVFGLHWADQVEIPLELSE